MPDDTTITTPDTEPEIANGTIDLEQAEIDEFIASLTNEDTVEEPTSTDETPPVGESAPVETLPESSTDGVWAFDDGLQVSREQAHTLAQFDAWLAANPELATQIAGLAQGQYEVVPRGVSGDSPEAPILPAARPASPQMPEGLDLDDPVQKHIWDELNTTRSQLDAASEVLTRHETQIQQSTQATTQALVNRAATEYATSHSLSADDMQQVRETAARLNVVGSLMDPFDPLTGLPRQVDPVDAIHQAFDTAYWSIPEFRQRAMQDAMKTRVEDMRKKSKMTALGGSSGSVPRQPSAPANEQERRDMMIKEVAAMMNGEGE